MRVKYIHSGCDVNGDLGDEDSRVKRGNSFGENIGKEN